MALVLTVNEGRSKGKKATLTAKTSPITQPGPHSGGSTHALAGRRSANPDCRNEPASPSWASSTVGASSGSTLPPNTKRRAKTRHRGQVALCREVCIEGERRLQVGGWRQGARRPPGSASLFCFDHTQAQWTSLRSRDLQNTEKEGPCGKGTPAFPRGSQSSQHWHLAFRLSESKPADSVNKEQSQGGEYKTGKK